MFISSVQSAEIAQTIAKPAAETQKAEDATTATKPYYFSPALVIDPKAGTAVLEYLNSSTGAVINQYPSEKDIKAYSQNTPKPAEVTKEAVASTVTTQPAVVASVDTKAPATASTTQSTNAVSSTAVIV